MKPYAASILMNILYLARMSRYDLLRATCRLSTYITKWTDKCDKRLKRLVEYMAVTPHLRLVGWIGDDSKHLTPCLWTDADLGGCPESQRSTSGIHMALKGPMSSFPLNGVCKRQGSLSQATTEAEIVAANLGLKTVGTH